MNDETARLNLSASAYRTYEWWRTKKKKSPEEAYKWALLAFNDNRKYEQEKRKVT